MKKVINQKWILSAFLIAALGSQYYYSVSSQQILSADFASTVDVSPDDLDHLVGPAQTPASAGGPSAATTVVQPTAPAPVPGATQAAAPQACSECVTWVFPSVAEANAAAAAVNNWTAVIKAQQATQAQTAHAPAAPAPAPAVAADVPETPESICADEPANTRARCIRRERDNLRQEAERDALDLRNEEFEGKMEDYAARYPNNLETLSSRFQSLLRTYSGRKKIEPAVAQRVFAKYIEPLLRQRMNSADQSPESLQALQDTILNISNSLPADYRGINNLIAADIRRAAEARAALVRSKLQEARQAYNDKDFITSQDLWSVAEQDRRRLLTEFNGSPRDGISGYYDMLANSLKGADDQSNANMIPAVRNLFTQMNNDSANWLNVNSNSGSSTTGSNTTGSRGGRGTVAAPSTAGTSNIGPALPNSGNMTIGSPNTSMQGGRTGRNN